MIDNNHGRVKSLQLTRLTTDFGPIFLPVSGHGFLGM